MKRVLVFILSLLILLPCTAKPFTADALMLPNPRLVARGGIQLCRAAGQYPSALRLLAYSAKGVKHVRFGAESVFSKALAESEQLRALAETNEGNSGSISFYGCGDLEYAVGLASYTVTYEETENGLVAVFIISDRYDFNELREGSSFSALMNNIGYILQERGKLHIYDWTAEVKILLTED